MRPGEIRAGWVQMWKMSHARWTLTQDTLLWKWGALIQTQYYGNFTYLKNRNQTCPDMFTKHDFFMYCLYINNNTFYTSSITEVEQHYAIAEWKLWVLNIYIKDGSTIEFESNRFIQTHIISIWDVDPLKKRSRETSYLVEEYRKTHFRI